MYSFIISNFSFSLPLSFSGFFLKSISSFWLFLVPLEVRSIASLIYDRKLQNSLEMKIVVGIWIYTHFGIAQTTNWLVCCVLIADILQFYWQRFARCFWALLPFVFHLPFLRIPTCIFMSFLLLLLILMIFRLWYSPCYIHLLLICICHCHVLCVKCAMCVRVALNTTNITMCANICERCATKNITAFAVLNGSFYYKYVR